MGSILNLSEVSLLNQINLVIDVGMKHLNSLLVCPFPTIEKNLSPQLFIAKSLNHMNLAVIVGVMKVYSV